MSLTEIKAEIPAEQAAVADDTLLERGFENWSVLEDVPARRAWIMGIVSEPEASAEPRRAWDAVRAALEQAGVRPLAEPVFRALEDADWRESYKAHFQPSKFGRLHWVPVWQRESYPVPPGDAALWLDPGLAFGTGNHETTRLCVERLVLLAEERRSRGRVIDAGCGSGILALSAALLGFAEVVAFDHDPEAIRVSEENAAANGMGGRIRFFVADLAAGLAAGPADILLANIQADVLIRHARELVEAVAPGGALVLSGILASENSDVRRTFEKLTPNWSLNARTMGDWSDVQLVRPA